MDRYWFFTWRTYGTWLPGQAGFVGHYRDPDGQRVKDNAPGEPTTEPIPALARYAAQIMTGEPVILELEQARALCDQLQETARFRGRAIDALAVLRNHVHLVFGTPGDPEAFRLLEDWKAYASRALNRLCGWAPPAPRPVWWERDGSKRILRTPAQRAAAIRYVRDQEGPLVVWLSEQSQALLEEYPEEPGEPRA